MSCEQCVHHKDEIEMLVSGPVPCKKEIPVTKPCVEYKPNFVTRFNEAVERAKKRE